MTAGRACPLHYRYSPASLARPAELAADTLYVVGGLYGNPHALAAIVELAQREAPPPILVFNGDFNWFNVDAAGFAAVNDAVLRHVALRGNVETEIAGDDDSAGCGCAYPPWVEDAVVENFNAIIRRLRTAARRFPPLRARLGALPMTLVAEVGGLRLGIVHGDAESLAGWGFAAGALADGAEMPKQRTWFDQARVRLFASTHTCLPVLRTLPLAAGTGAVINNGAAGMPNFRGCHYGLISRISVHPFPGRAIYGLRLDGVHVDAVAVDYDPAAWQASFLANWPPGSAAWRSYFRRISRGPEYSLRQAQPPLPAAG